MDVMEDEFYDGILGFLEERGITDEFIENLCHVGTGLKYSIIWGISDPEWSSMLNWSFVDQLKATDIENNKYRDLLLGLKDFVQ